MMARFVDTSYFLALLIPGDENHADAVALAARLREPLITTDWILVEVGNFLAPQRSRFLFPSLVEIIEADSRMTIVGYTA